MGWQLWQQQRVALPADKKVRMFQDNAAARLGRRAAHGFANRLFDRACGSVTSASAQLSDLTIVDGGQHQDLADRRYEGAPVLTCVSLIRLLPSNRGEYTFIDYGSGKGRVALLAAALGYRRVIGVEFARELHEIAQSNVSRFRRRRFWRSTDIQVILGDAARFELPADRCVLFMYNPFPEPILHEVLIRLAQSYESKPRDMYLVYLNPRFLDPFADVECLRLFADGRFFGRHATIFRTSGAVYP